MTASLYDYDTAEYIGTATAEQVEASAQAGETGVILIDADGTVRHQSDDQAVYGELRSVYVQ